MAENLFNAPIPGQSLTRSPDQRGPYEQPPKFADTEQALDHLLAMVMDKDFIKNFGTLVSKNRKLYIDKMASAILQKGFVNGMWTVDTMMLLVEPLICLLVWAAAQQDATVTFSTDTGYEDRTGFDYVTDALVGDPQEVAIPHETDKEAIRAKQATAKESAEGHREAPREAVAQPSQSPLVGGQ